MSLLLSGMFNMCIGCLSARICRYLVGVSSHGAFHVTGIGVMCAFVKPISRMTVSLRKEKMTIYFVFLLFGLVNLPLNYRPT